MLRLRFDEPLPPRIATRGEQFNICLRCEATHREPPPRSWLPRPAHAHLHTREKWDWFLLPFDAAVPGPQCRQREGNSPLPYPEQRHPHQGRVDKLQLPTSLGNAHHTGGSQAACNRRHGEIELPCYHHSKGQGRRLCSISPPADCFRDQVSGAV